jgi:hypothetical protein
LAIYARRHCVFMAEDLEIGNTDDEGWEVDETGAIRRDPDDECQDDEAWTRTDEDGDLSAFGNVLIETHSTTNRDESERPFWLREGRGTTAT